MKILALLFTVIISLNAYTGTMSKVVVKVYSSISKSKSVVSDAKITKLSKMSDGYKGTKSVKRYIGKLNLPTNAQEDLYLRIAIYQNKINRTEAASMFRNLKGKDGFRSTLSKIIGNNPQGTVGHINELKIANEGRKSGFDVIGIGKKFNDGIKKSDTDIDVLLRKNNTDILIEAKIYSSTTKMDLIKFRADLDTLVIYANKISKRKAIKVFSFTEKPKSDLLLKQYQFWADKKGVQLIFGNPREQIEQIKMLERIL